MTPDRPEKPRRALRHWGSTAEEIHGAMPGDDFCPSARIVATRSITIAAPPVEVFPWIRQMGFGRAGWYSWDVIDNLGRRSATTIHPEWQNVNTGDAVPGGPIDFRAALVEPPHSFVLMIGPNNNDDTVRDEAPASEGRLCFTLAYHLRDHPEGTRLVTRMRAHVNLPGGSFIERFFLSPGDGIMVRRQLGGIARRAGRTA